MPGVRRASSGSTSLMRVTFKLEQPDGTPADPPTIVLGVYVWKPGDWITLGAGRTFASLTSATGARTSPPCRPSRTRCLLSPVRSMDGQPEPGGLATSGTE
jgi:hypothetical protein